MFEEVQPISMLTGFDVQTAAQKTLERECCGYGYCPSIRENIRAFSVGADSVEVFAPGSVDAIEQCIENFRNDFNRSNRST